MQINLRAGRRAKAATAWSAAADYFRAGMRTIRESDWEDHFDLCFALHFEGAECEYLAGNGDRSKELFSAMLPRTRNDVERASIYRLRTRIVFSLGNIVEALEAGVEGLRLLGYPWAPDDLESQQVFMAELAQVETNLRGRRIEDLIDAPEVQDPTIRVMLEIFDSMLTPAYNKSQTAFGVVMLRAVNMALKHGHADVCAYAYVSLGMIFCAVLNRIEEGLAFGKLAMELLKKYPNAMQIPRVYICVGTCQQMVGPLRDVEPYMNIARQSAMDAGDLSMLGVSGFLGPLTKYGAGDQIDDVLDSADRAVAIIRRTREFL